MPVFNQNASKLYNPGDKSSQKFLSQNLECDSSFAFVLLFPKVAHKILSTGKYLNVIRQCGKVMPNVDSIMVTVLHLVKDGAY